MRGFLCSPKLSSATSKASLHEPRQPNGDRALSRDASGHQRRDPQSGADGGALPASCERRTRFGRCLSAIRCRKSSPNPSRYLVVFLSQEPDPEVVGALLGEDHSPEAIAIEGAEAYVWTPDGVKAMTL